MSIRDCNQDHETLHFLFDESFPPDQKWKSQYLACQAQFFGSNFPKCSIVSNWYLVICLDGAPESAEHNNSWSQGREREFRSIVLETANERNGVCFQNFFPSFWKDGFLIGCNEWSDARHLALFVGRKCRAVNDQQNLPWDQQLHARAGIKKTVAGALTNLLQAARDRLFQETMYREESLG